MSRATLRGDALPRDAAGSARAARVGRIAAVAAVLALLVTILVLAPTPSQALSVRVLSHGDRSRPEIALTFDDGVSPENCRRILAILVQQRAPATFFPIGSAMSLDPGFWRLAADAGYPIGDHTFSHPQLPTLGLAAQTAQIRDGRTVAEAVIGRPILRVLRPPYGAYDTDTLTAAARDGFGTLLDWDVSDRDTSLHGTVAQRLSAAEQGTNGSVVLLHCGPNATPYLLADLIGYYRSHGFRLVTIPELLDIAWSPGTTRVVTPAEILDGLSPLASTPAGGVITGPNGWVAPSPGPTPGAPSELAPWPSPAPSSAAAASAADQVAPTPSEASAAAGGSPAAVATDPAAADGLAVPALPALVALLMGAAVVGLVAAGIRARRRRPRSR